MYVVITLPLKNGETGRRKKMAMCRGEKERGLF
jgi:hypothetical protein